MAENKCAARLEPSSRDMSELKNRFKPGYDWETICSTTVSYTHLTQPTTSRV